MADAEPSAPSPEPDEREEPLPAVPGHEFRDPDLLRRALTHCSHSGAHNERLEFLGDAVISAVVAEVLYRETDECCREGALSLARARLVSREALARAARTLGLCDHLRLGVGEVRTGGAGKDRILCGALEAVLGAVFLDGGYAAARETTLRILGESLDGQHVAKAVKDPRNVLQELAQARGLPLPVYEVVLEEGKPHDRTYEVKVSVGRVSATGIGASKKGACRSAAEEVLTHIERFPFVLDEPPPGTGEPSP